MTTAELLRSAAQHVGSLKGRTFDLLTISRPASVDAAVSLVKVVSKLSPLLGNLIEFSAVAFLNEQPEYKSFGLWKRQDPDFPDAIFEGSIKPSPGLEIKAWLPFSTEITARFRNSQTYFAHDNVYVCMLAWTLDGLFFGKPVVVDVCIASAKSVAEARDNHYHNPPDYLVIEPEDTTSRTRNLQQTNVNGYKWQDTAEKRGEAEKLVEAWGKHGKTYSPSAPYQAKLRVLLSRFRYRLDTNFAKMDRIVHSEIEDFKKRVLASEVHGLTVGEWGRLSSDVEALQIALEKRFHIGRER